MANFEYTDPIITKRRSGDKSSPYVDKDEAHIVNFGKVTLTELPDEVSGVRVVGLGRTWSEIKQGLPSINQFHVDYNNKIVTFNIENNGKQLQFLYKGTGLIYIPTSMIYTKAENGNVVETLEELFANTDKSIEDLTGVKNDAISAANIAATQANYAKTQGDTAKNLTDQYQTFVYGQTEIPKEAVATFSAIATKYPSPSNGWTVYVTDVKKMYRYSGTESKWLLIRSVGDIVQGSVAPVEKMGLWIDTSK